MGLLCFFHFLDSVWEEGKRSGKVEMWLMGLQENENGEMGLSAVSLGSNSKYRIMDYELTEYGDENDA